MRKPYWTSLVTLFMLLALCPSKTPAQGTYDYVVTVGDETLRFVRRPELGYVVVSREETTAVEALDGTLRQFGARDIREVRGLGRRGMSVVFSQRPASENENTITMLRARSQIKYAAPLFSSNSETVAVIPEIVVRLRPGQDDEQLRALFDTMGLVIKKKLEFTDREYLIEVSTIDASGVFGAVEQLNQASFVEWAVPNVAFHPQLLGQVIPNDTYFPNQWHLNNTGQSGGTPNADINAPEAWEISTGDPNIIVAVLDDGVDTDHPDLVNNIVAGYDFYGDDSNPNPTGDDAHGTACAGLIAAQGNNGIGVTGVTWNCKIMPIRIAGASGFITEADIATAIRWAANNGAEIMSNSWGGNFSMPTIHSAIIDVTELDGMGREGKGCVVLFASGNSGDSVIYPAKYAEVIAVGATNKNDNRWSYSCYGPELDIVAPSGNTNLNGDIWTTDIVGSAGFNNREPAILDYTDRMGGTSAACPIAAGAAALVLSIEPNLTNLDVQDILQDSAVDLGSPGFDYSYGYGRVDACSALERVQMLPPAPGSISYPLSSDTGQYTVNWSSSSGATSYQLERSDNGGNSWTQVYSGSNISWPETIGNGSYRYRVKATNSVGPSNWKIGTWDCVVSLLVTQQWVKRYNGPGNSGDEAMALAVDGLGNIYVTGRSYGSSTGYDYATIKYDPDGNQLWVSRYNGPPGNRGDDAYALAMDDSGNVYVTGGSIVSGANYDYATIKYDSNGSELWVRRYNGPGNSIDRAYALAVDNSGNVYVTGESTGSGLKYDYATVKYNPDGSELWVARYNGISNNHDFAYALAVDGLGNVYVTGESYSGSASYDYATIKYDSNGSELWVRRYNGPGNSSDNAYALAMDDSGNVYVTGGGTSTDNDYATIKYDSNGIQLWVKRYNGLGSNSDYAKALAVDGLGNVYVTGESYGSSTDYDYATIKYDSNGSELWVKRYNGTGNDNDYAKALAVDCLGNVYVTGRSYGGGTSYDCATIKYAPNGNEVWVKRYNGPVNLTDSANALAVDGSGSVYVTGYSRGSSNLDYVTIKYSQRDYCTAVLDGDLDSNCKVDIADIELFAEQWLDPFDFIDYAILAEDWLECNFALEEDCW